MKCADKNRCSTLTLESACTQTYFTITWKMGKICFFTNCCL